VRVSCTQSQFDIQPLHLIKHSDPTTSLLP